jgi:hypothetical protein
MKLIFILLAAFFSGALFTTSYGQTSDAEAEAMINLLGVQKKEAVAKLVYIAQKDSVAFWKVYDEYDALNRKTAKARLGLYERTAHAYSDLTPAIADTLATQYFANRFDQEKTLEQYYKKMKAATNAVTAFQFYQSEVYILTQLRASIMQQIPTYGQLVHASNK